MSTFINIPDFDGNNIGANKDLSNLNSPTDINEPLQTADNPSGDSDNLIIRTGTASGTRGTLDLDAKSIESFQGLIHLDPLLLDDFWTIETPSLMIDSTLNNTSGNGFVFGSTDVDTNLIPSTHVGIQTGALLTNSSNDGTGGIYINSGAIRDAAASGDTGQVIVETGANIGSGNSNGVDLRTGNVDSGNSGDINVKAGTSNSGTRGSFNIDTKQTNIGTGTNTNPFSNPTLVTDIQINAADALDHEISLLTDQVGFSLYASGSGGTNSSTAYIGTNTAGGSLAFMTDTGKDQLLVLSTGEVQIGHVDASSLNPATTPLHVIGDTNTNTDLLQVEDLGPGSGIVFSINSALQVDVHNNPIINGANPSNPQDLATKIYVDKLRKLIGCRYNDASATVTGSASNVSFANQDWDTDSAYSVATFTAPIAGIYEVSYQLLLTASFVATDTATGFIYKNGNIYTRNQQFIAGVQPDTMVYQTDQVSLAANDTIIIKVASDRAGTSIGGNGTYNYLNIKFIGTL